MKKSMFLFTLALTIVIASCKKNENAPAGGGSTSGPQISTDQKAFVLKFSATWCGPCMSTGLSVSKELHTKYPYNEVAVHMQCAPNDQTIASGNKAPGHSQMQSAYGVSGIPAIIVGTKKVSTSFSSCQAEIDPFIAKPTTAGIGLSKSISGNTMTINYKVKFFNDFAEGAKLALYVIENGVPITHANASSLDNVFRGLPTGMDGWGTTLSASAIAKGTPYEGTATYTLISDVKDPSKLEVVGVLYSAKMNGSLAASVINANSTVKH